MAKGLNSIKPDIKEEGDDVNSFIFLRIYVCTCSVHEISALFKCYCNRGMKK